LVLEEASLGGAETRGADKMSTREYPENPQVAVGAIVIKDGRVLLVRRGQPPSKGLWAIPGGRVELGETLKEAAEREIIEETGLTICAGDPVYTFDVIERDDAGHIRFHYVIVDLVADYLSGKINPSDDASEARWVTPEELEGLPMNETTRKVLTNVVHFGR
jgi:8-oxo-dGTP diphosphatase